MKKIFIALAVLASVQIAGAQVKPDAAKKALDAAVADSQNAKKATKAATWTALGKAYVTAYDAPAGNIWQGATKNDLKLVMGGENPSSTETAIVAGEQMTKEVYSNKNLYFNGAGQVAVIEVTKPVAENALAKAAEAYQKAYSLDPKTAKTSTEAIQKISEKLSNEAYSLYNLGKYSEASALFEQAARVVADAPVNKVDTSALYNAGFTALNAGDNATATRLFKECLSLGYYSENGDIYAKLAEVDAANAKSYLEEGFQKFPQSQSILIGLINYYLTNEESTDRLFELLAQAKQNEPDNASLYYVEGNIHAQLGNTEEAVKAYQKCTSISPDYEYGYIGEGILYYNLAVDDQEKASEEMDDNKYMELVAKFEKDLKACIEPFEKAYALTKDDSIKVSIAEYLKNAYYRFSSTDDAMKAAYDKYSEVVSTGVPK